jgi:two-component system alkaline phosphatase synthesis response regulator PhoP
MPDRKRILIADDDPDLLELLKIALTYQDQEIVAVPDGRQALQMAMAQKFSLIILDVMMPYIDGYHVAHEISDKLGAKAPAILIMTSRDIDSEKSIALMSGAEEIIQKPFQIAKFQAKVLELLAKARPE